MVGLAIFIILTAVSIWSWLFYELYKSPEKEKKVDRSDPLFKFDDDEEFLG